MMTMNPKSCTDTRKRLSYLKKKKEEKREWKEQKDALAVKLSKKPIVTSALIRVHMRTVTLLVGAQLESKKKLFCSRPQH